MAKHTLSKACVERLADRLKRHPDLDVIGYDLAIAALAEEGFKDPSYWVPKLIEKLWRQEHILLSMHLGVLAAGEAHRQNRLLTSLQDAQRRLEQYTQPRKRGVRWHDTDTT